MMGNRLRLMALAFLMVLLVDHVLGVNEKLSGKQKQKYRSKSNKLEGEPREARHRYSKTGQDLGKYHKSKRSQQAPQAELLQELEIEEPAIDEPQLKSRKDKNRKITFEEYTEEPILEKKNKDKKRKYQPENLENVDTRARKDKRNTNQVNKVKKTKRSLPVEEVPIIEKRGTKRQQIVVENIPEEEQEQDQELEEQSALQTYIAEEEILPEEEGELEEEDLTEEITNKPRVKRCYYE